MKLKTLFLIITILALFSGGILSYNHNFKVIPAAFEKDIGNYLSVDIEAKAELIDNHFSKINEDILFLANSPRIKNMLRQETSTSEYATKLTIDSKVDIISKEVENYILNNPDLTIKDLKKDFEFQKIIVQKFENNGYSLAIDESTEEIYFHPNSNLIGMKAKEAAGNDIGTYILFKKAQINGESYGYYNWIDGEGKNREKYGHFKKVNIKTREGISLIIEVTDYVDSYRTIKNLNKKDDEFLKEFSNTNDYMHVLFYNKDGFLIYEADNSFSLGTNIKNLHNSKYKNILNLVKNNDNNKTVFRDFFIINEHTFILNAFPVYDNGEYLGILSIHEKIDNINEMYHKDALKILKI